MIYVLRLFIVAQQLLGLSTRPISFFWVQSCCCLQSLWSLSVAASRHVLAIKNLTHRIALLEKELEKRSDHE